MYSMGQGSSISGGDSGPAESGSSFGNIGGLTVGDYYGRGSQPAKSANQQLIVLAVVAVAVVVVWKFKK